MSSRLRWALTLIAVQGGLVGLYLWVEGNRAEPSAPIVLSTEPPERLDLPLPSLQVRRRDGSAELLSAGPRPTVVHIWASWCEPCREELPALLAVPSRHAIDVVAIALDDDWSTVDGFFQGGAPDHVVLADGNGAQRALAVTRLPVTFLVREDGRMVLRFDGARDWSDEGFFAKYVTAPLAER